jgi:uncharacterized protein (TIGR03067 family)
MGLYALTVSAGLGLLAADDTAKAEQDKLQGTWAIVSLEVAGDEVPKEQLEGITLTIEGDKHTVKRGDDVLAERTCKLDPTKSPKQIDGKYVGGPNDGKATLGIYELNGDTLKYCFGPPDGERPKDFSTKADSDTRMAVYKRQKS